MYVINFIKFIYFYTIGHWGRERKKEKFKNKTEYKSKFSILFKLKKKNIKNKEKIPTELEKCSTDQCKII